MIDEENVQQVAQDTSQQLQQAILTIQSLFKTIEKMREILEKEDEKEYQQVEKNYFQLRGNVDMMILPFLNTMQEQLTIVIQGYYETYEVLKYVQRELTAWHQPQATSPRAQYRKKQQHDPDYGKAEDGKDTGS